MLRKNCNYSFMDGLTIREIPPKSFTLSRFSDDSELNRLLSVVFAFDENGNCDGDLAYMFRKDADPEIMDWIKKNFQFDTTSCQSEPIPSWMSDDEAIRLSRGQYETREDYALRMHSELSNIKKMMKSKSVAS